MGKAGSYPLQTVGLVGAQLAVSVPSISSVVVRAYLGQSRTSGQTRFRDVKSKDPS